MNNYFRPPWQLAVVPSLARKSTSDLFGKLNADLPKMRLDDETAEGLKKLAAANGMSTTECARLLIQACVHGSSHVAHVAAQRVLRVTKSAP